MQILAHAGRSDKVCVCVGGHNTYTDTGEREEEVRNSAHGPRAHAKTHARAVGKRPDTCGPPPTEVVVRKGAGEGARREMRQTRCLLTILSAEASTRTATRPLRGGEGGGVCLCVCVPASSLVRFLDPVFVAARHAPSVHAASVRAHALTTRSGLSCGATQTRRRTASESAMSSSRRRASPGASSSRSGHSG